MQVHNDHCKQIAEYLDAIVSGELYHDADGNEYAVEYEPAYGYDMYVTHVWDTSGDKLHKVRVALTTLDGVTYKRGDTGEVIDDIDYYLEPISLYDYFEDSIYNIEYRVGSRYEDPSSVQIMVACGGPNIYIDTKSGDVELYWWNETGSYPMRSATIAAIDDFACELYNC
jgi:hypothetical protein